MGVVWHGVKEFGDSLARIDERVHAASKAGTVAAGDSLRVIAAATAPKGATERLAGSVISRTTTISGQPTTQVGPTIIYGRRNDLGFKGKTKSGKQRRKGVLSTEVFKANGKGVRVGWSSRGLQPTKPSHFMERALEGATSRLAEVWRRAWADAITKL